MKQLLRVSVFAPILSCARSWILTTLAGVLALMAQDPPKSPGWVVIPVREYANLRVRAYPQPPEPEPGPVEAVLSSAEYELRVENGIASGQARFVVDVFKDGWVRVPLPSGILIREAKLDGKPVSLVPSGKSAGLSAVLPKRGRSILTLQVGVPVNTSAGEEKLQLQPTGSPITKATVLLGRQDVDVRVTGGLIAEKSHTGAETQWCAFGRSGEVLTFIWRRKLEETRSVLPLRMRGLLTQVVGLGEDSTSINAEVNLEILQGAARNVRLQVPSTISINQVLGATVGDWEAKGGELTVNFLEPAEQSVKFLLVGEVRLPRDGAIDVPVISLTGTERDSGGIALEVLGAGEFKDIKTQGLERTEPAALGQLVASRQSPSLTAFRFPPLSPGMTRKLSVQVVRYDQQAVLTANIEEARYRVLVSAEGKTLVQARYAVQNNQKNFLRVKLPEGAVVWSSALGGLPVHAGQAPDGSLLLPLAKVRSGEESPAVAVELLYLQRGTAWTDKGRTTLDLPALDLPVSRTGVVLYHPPGFRVSPENGVFRAGPYERPSSPALDASVAGGAVPGGAGATAPAMNANIGLDMQREFNQKPQTTTDALVANFRANAGRRAAVAQPIKISFPAVGPSLYFVSELTGENQAPKLDLSFQRGQQEKKARKGGSR